MSRVSQAEAWRRVRSVLEMSDLVLEVIDSRDPVETRNKRVEELLNKLGKPLIIVINKADLVPIEVLKEWKEYLGREHPTVFISAKNRLGTRKLIVSIKQHAPRLPVRVSVVGYPNVGKSTIINYLKGRHVAETSPVPGWTIGEQVVRAKQWLIVIDTPGVIPPEEVRDEALLIIKGAIDPTKLEDPVLPAVKLIMRIKSFNPKAFMDRYGIDAEDPMELLELVGRKRGLLLKGGKVNIREAAIAVIRDWILGKLTYYYRPGVIGNA
ncbi:GTPase [Vulcanisaeta distributa]|uniref:GTP-binding protein HSR1-related protein n=1 Tax=Vulcanisaeta distributa (strain DSM 14429 / JCM 11212 / NBRC 100878 / IC-017) TaxID=572478 RepID=E1QQ87_VULDI|nr:GTPase [Vulcanisaeta distributa]ADN51574.1 GTP-binding protein HSR1-related protein [Vulcanisaeta distributa DSM 14429]